MDNPKEDILITPGWPVLIDGLGYMFLVVSGMPEIDNAGRRIVKFMLKCGDKERKRYSLSANKLNKNMNYELIAQEHDLIPLNMYDSANKKWLYVKSLLGEETPLSFRERDLKIKMDEKEKTILTLQAENIWLNEQITLIKTNPAKAISQYGEVFSEAIKSVGQVYQKSQEQKT